MIVRTAVALLCAGAALAWAAPSALAAAELDVASGGAPRVLLPGQQSSSASGHSQTSAGLILRNVGDTAITAGQATVTITAPEALSIESVDGGFVWPGCTVQPSGQQAICAGPAAGYEIAAGASTCSFSSFAVACPISVGYRAAEDAPKGVHTTTVEMCVTGVSPCATVGLDTVIQDYGDSYGIAPINQPGADSVPLIPGGKAFWAGSCDRSAAPAIGAPIPAPGVGSRPSQIWVPGGESALDVSLNRVAAPAPAIAPHCIDLGDPTQYRTSETGIWFQAPSWLLPASSQAGSRPDGTNTTAWKRDASGGVDGAVDNIYVDLPPGFVGNPNAVEKCTQEQFASRPPKCSPASQVGLLHLLIRARGLGAAGHGPFGNYKVYPVWNLEPRRGRVAELGLAYASGERAVSVRLTAKARTNGDFGVTAFTGQIPAALAPIVQTITIWGVPWNSANDIWRAPRELRHGNGEAIDPCTVQAGVDPPGSYVPHSGFAPECRQSYDPSWGPIQPFLSQETDCNDSPVVDGWTDSYQNQGGFTADGDPDRADSEFDQDAVDPGWKTASSAQAAVTGCEKLGFEPDIEFGTSTSAADGSTGLTVDLSIPQNDVPPFSPPGQDAPPAEVEDYVEAAVEHWRSDAGLATAHLKDTVVTLPEGVAVNPSAATGLEGCSDAVMGVREQGDPLLFDNRDPSDGLDGDDCPDGSRIGTVEVETPVLDEPLVGDVILGAPKSTDPQSGGMLRTFLVLRSKERGLVAKIYGSTKADPQTGQLTATFRNNPEVPFSRLRLDLKGGPKGVLAMPQRCGTPAWAASFTPWSSVGAPVAVPDAPDDGTFGVDADCGFGFAPALTAGMSTQAARANGDFSFRFARPQGQQWARGLTAKLPQGLLASVRDVPLCTDAQAGAGSCPAGSRIGVVDAKAGSGNPFVLERKGEVFLTEGYKGGEYGLMVKVRAIAGPFRGAMELSPIVVRQAIHVDRATAQVTAISDPLPLVHHGIPLRVREVTVRVDRERFMLNPSGCAPRRVGADLSSPQGRVASLSNPFRASGCAALPFRPKLALRLTGRSQVRSFRHPGIRAQVTQAGVGEAGISKAKVTLPKSLALDVNNAQALCEFEDGTKPDLENHCPRGSIVGRARAASPLLNDPLVGNVYFVKNVRRDPKTGNVIRTLPMVIAALRGEIAINLVGESSVDNRNRLVSTFASVPDAPVSRFNMNIKGGANGIIAVTRTKRALINLCARPKSHVAESDIDGHNGRRHDTNVRMATPCTRKQVKRAKKAAKRATRAGKAGG